MPPTATATGFASTALESGLDMDALTRTLTRDIVDLTALTYGGRRTTGPALDGVPAVEKENPDETSDSPPYAHFNNFFHVHHAAQVRRRELSFDLEAAFAAPGAR